jgi:hypothetical protein
MKEILSRLVWAIIAFYDECKYEIKKFAKWNENNNK